MNIQEIVITGKRQVELQSAALDESKLGPAEALIETESTFISAGTELSIYTAHDPKVYLEDGWCRYPWKAGYANLGTVKAAGSRVTRAAPGRRVLTFGPHASAFVYDTNRLIIEVPDDLPADLAVASRMPAISYAAIWVADIRPNRWVAVFGLGWVGNMAAQLFQIMGCRVIGVDPSPRRREIAEQCGIANTLGGVASEVQAAIKEITDGRGAGITVDAVGHGAVCTQCLDATADFGELIVLGSPRGELQGDINHAFSAAHYRWVTIKGALEWIRPTYPQDDSAIGSDIDPYDSMYNKQQTLFDWIARGKLKLDPLISHHMKPEQIKEAYEGLWHQKDEYLGVVLDWEN